MYITIYWINLFWGIHTWQFIVGTVSIQRTSFLVIDNCALIFFCSSGEVVVFDLSGTGLCSLKVCKLVC